MPNKLQSVRLNFTTPIVRTGPNGTTQKSSSSMSLSSTISFSIFFSLRLLIRIHGRLKSIFRLIFLLPLFLLRLTINHTQRVCMTRANDERFLIRAPSLCCIVSWYLTYDPGKALSPPDTWSKAELKQCSRITQFVCFQKISSSQLNSALISKSDSPFEGRFF